MNTQEKYPYWPWITLIVCGSLFLLFAIWRGLITSEMHALNRETEGMQSVDYVAGTVVESFFRGYLGDPFGKSNEEAQKQDGISS